ncbi:MAG: SDR family NAD(P)-dependent oxidoreductase [Pseudomonadota bacterium]
MKKIKEPIAIVGIGCRFPGKANNADSMWSMMMEGTDAIIEIPKDRWNIDKFYHEDMGIPGKTYSKWGGFIDEIDKFDSECFSISPREAELMDPQQRILLEVAWEALEDSGQQVDKLAGSNTGVYIGLCTNDYAQIQTDLSEDKPVDPYSATGNAFSIIANRLSYCLDFHGPSFVVDTACSSSLVATHLACSSLLNNECDIALAGGVNLILLPSTSISFSAATMLSPDGRCKAFDSRANGFVRSEGAGMVVLKRLSTALADNDQIYAVINGSGINQDGHTNGISLPNKDAQADLIELVYQQAGIAPNKVFYVEAHGTGTAVGDPIEAFALGEKFGSKRKAGDNCLIGSVKTNIGHLEASAGVAGLIKASLCLKHRTIPPNLHFLNPNPNIPFDKFHLEVPTKPVKYPKNQQQDMIVGVNSFGFGGTNAHAVLSEYRTKPNYRRTRKTKNLCKNYVLTLSARSEKGLKSLASSYINFFEKNKNIHMADVVYTANRHRTNYNHRLSVIVDSLISAKNKLQNYIDDKPQTSIFQRQIMHNKKFKLAFVFSGQGPQWWAMGRQLLETEAVFRRKIKSCDKLMARYANWSLLDELTADENNSRMGETEISQPLIFALQVALAELWKSRGIVADALVGHSVGEVAAAHISGALSLATAIKVIYYRGLCMSHAQGLGGMIAAALNLEQAEKRIKRYNGKINIAGINSPTSITFSGAPKLLDELAIELEQDAIFYKKLDVQFAFHSEQMDSVKDELIKSLSKIKLGKIQIPIYSTVSGIQVEQNIFDSHYWWHNVRNKVYFSSAIQNMIADDYDVFIEIGPHPVLSASIVENAQSKKVVVIPSLRRNNDESQTMLGAIGSLYTLGYPIEWEKIHKKQGYFIHLPGYPWQKQSFWHESESYHQLRTDKITHPFLKYRIPTADTAWYSNINLLYYPYLADHKVRDRIIFPAAAFIEMSVAAAQQILKNEAFVLEDLHIQKPLFINEKNHPILEFLKHADDPSFLIRSASSHTDTNWTIHCKGHIRKISKPAATVDLKQLKQSCNKYFSADSIYKKFEEIGLNFGPSFRGLSGVYVGNKIAIGDVRLLEINKPSADSYHFHPALLDACLQTFIGLLSEQFSNIYIPIAFEHLYFYQDAQEQMCTYSELLFINNNSLVCNLKIYSTSGQLLIEILGFRCQRINLHEKNKQLPIFYQYHWQHSPIKDISFPYNKANFLPKLSSMADKMNQQLITYQQWYGGTERLNDLEVQLNILAKAYILNAFIKLGCSVHKGKLLSIENLVSKQGVKKHYQQLLQRFFVILEEHGYIKLKTNTSAIIKKTFKPYNLTTLWSQSLNSNPSAFAELSLIRNCGSHLSDVLIGQQDPQKLIPVNTTSTSLIEHLYSDSPTSMQYQCTVQKAIKLVIKHLPIGRSLRILEIGAGTGGMTCGVLEFLPKDHIEYYFTDMSDSFFTSAEQRFNDYPFLHYQILDIEKDIQKQGYELHSFDVVLGENVLHATKNIQTALQNIHQLMAPSGLLVIMEKQPQAWFDITFALLDYCWHFEDHNLRPDYPLISRQDWNDTLIENGFVSTQFIPYKESSQVVFIAQTKPIIAQKNTTLSALKKLSFSSKKDSFKSKNHWLIFADKSGISDALKELLISIENTVTLVYPSDNFACLDKTNYQIKPGNKQHIRQLLTKMSHYPELSIIHLWSMDLKACEAVTNDKNILNESRSCHTIISLLQALHESKLNKCLNHLLLVTQGAQAIEIADDRVHVEQSPMIGLARVIQDELSEINCKSIDLDPEIELTESVQFLYAELFTKDKENEVVNRYNERFAPRLIKSEQAILSVDNTNSEHSIAFSLNVKPVGQIKNLCLEQKIIKALKADQVCIEVHAVALNFRDVMKTIGLYPTDDGADILLGDECSGVISAIGDDVYDFKVGDEVIAIAQECFTSHLTTYQQLVMPKPAKLNHQEAATIPVVFSTVYYALHHLAQIQKGDKILIQAAAGGVGLAAIQMAKHAGAEVFVTVSNQEKRELMHSLGADHIMNSRSLTFADEIMEITSGQGVDIVLNSLAGDAIAKGIDCLAPYGRFLELGKVDIFQNNNISLWAFRKNLSFFAIDLSQLMVDKPYLFTSMLKNVQKLMADQILSPLPNRVFPITRIKEAFRYMAQGKHIGKVVISMRESNVSVLPLREHKKVQFSKQASYLITGGLGGFGLTIANWIIENGGNNIILVGRSGADSEQAQQSLEKLNALGANVVVFKSDISDVQQVADLASRCANEMPPLKGIFHTAMVMDDGLILKMNEQQFNKVMAPKVQGTWNLHHSFATQKLDYFVLFSSISTLIGNPAQANYVAANFFLDMFAHYRRSQGLPANTINWGALKDIGYLSKQENKGIADLLEKRGLLGITSQQAMQIMNQVLLDNPIQISPVLIHWYEWGKKYHNHSLPLRYTKIIDEKELQSSYAGETGQIRIQIDQADTEQALEIVTQYMRKEVAAVLHLPVEKLKLNQPLNELGLDSLMMVELGMKIESDLSIALPTGQLMVMPSLKDLSIGILKLLGRKVDTPDKATVIALSSNIPQYPDCLVNLKTGTTNKIIYCFHPNGGLIFDYKILTDLLLNEVQVMGLQSCVLSGAEEEFSSIELMAEEYIKSIRAKQAHGPYYLLGFSFGGLVCHAAARILQDMNEQVAFLGMIDCPINYNNDIDSKNLLKQFIPEIMHLVFSFSSIFENASQADKEQYTTSFLQLFSNLKEDAFEEHIIAWLKQEEFDISEIELQLLQRYMSLFRSHIALINDYKLKPLKETQVHLWKASKNLFSLDNKVNSLDMLSHSKIHFKMIESTHYDILKQPKVNHIVNTVNQIMAGNNKIK